MAHFEFLYCKYIRRFQLYIPAHFAAYCSILFQPAPLGHFYRRDQFLFVICSRGACVMPLQDVLFSFLALFGPSRCYSSPFQLFSVHPGVIPVHSSSFRSIPVLFQSIPALFGPSRCYSSPFQLFSVHPGVIPVLSSSFRSIPMLFQSIPALFGPFRCYSGLFLLIPVYSGPFRCFVTPLV